MLAAQKCCRHAEDHACRYSSWGSMGPHDGRNWARNLQFEIKDPWYQHDISLCPARGRGCKRWRSKAVSHCCCGWVSSSLCLLTSHGIGMVAQGIYARFICPVTGCKRFSAADSEGCWKSQGPKSWGAATNPNMSLPEMPKCYAYDYIWLYLEVAKSLGLPQIIHYLSTETPGKWGSTITISRNPHTEVPSGEPT